MHLADSMTDPEAKIKKTRRGKRSGRRNRREGELKLDGENDTELSGSTNRLYKDLSSVKWRKFYVRPRYSPTAPHNSTQFLMDDQTQCLDINGSVDVSRDDLSLYGGHFDKSQCSEVGTPSSCGSIRLSLDKIDFQDIEFDCSTYMENDFESFYNQIRTEELSKLSKDELIEEIMCMEDKVSSLESCAALEGNKNLGLSFDDSYKAPKDRRKSNSTMFTLQEELEVLKRENERLKQEKNNLFL